MDKKEESRLQAVVEGRVQGVGFRYFVEEEAISLDLKGWVRNRWDGTVEVVVEGERHLLERFLSSLRRGPRAAAVTNVQVAWLPATGEFNSFYIRMTG